MKNTNIMYVKERKLKSGEIVYELRCSVKNIITNKFDNKVKTVRIPKDIIGKKERNKYLLDKQIKWKEELERQAKGIALPKDNNIIFCDYAQSWVDDILVFDKTAVSHYENSVNNMKIFKEKFGVLKLKDINLNIIQNFCKWLNNRKKITTTVTVIKSVKEYIKKERLKIVTVYTNAGISERTMDAASKVGEHINIDSAKKICNYLNVNINEFFDIKIKEEQYSLSANKHVISMLSSILRKAVKENYIDKNYASSEYIDKICGTVGEKQIIIEEEELSSLVKCIENEQDIRKKTAFTIALALGLRGTEIAGLEWKDFDFEKNTVSIQRDSICRVGHKAITRATKNKTSNRTLTMPEYVAEVIKDYRTWWLGQKELLGDYFGDTDRLFINAKRENITSDTISYWLKKFLKENKLKNITLHSLRHTNITMQIINGVDCKTVSIRAGHSNISTTMNIYSHYASRTDKSASEVINSVLYNKKVMN